MPIAEHESAVGNLGVPATRAPAGVRAAGVFRRYNGGMNILVPCCPPSGPPRVIVTDARGTVLYDGPGSPLDPITFDIPAGHHLNEFGVLVPDDDDTGDPEPIIVERVDRRS